MFSFLITSAAVLLIIHLWMVMNKKLRYWSNKNVPNLNPKTPAGDFLPTFLGKINQQCLVWNYYNEFRKKNFKYAGLYFGLGPVFLPVHLDVIKRILQADFEYFGDRGLFRNKKNHPLSENIFTLDLENWKILRSKLSPLFTPNKLKSNFPTIMDCSHKLNEVIAQKSHESINVYDLFLKYALDIFLRYLLGIEDLTVYNKDSIYSEAAKLLSEHSTLDVIKVAVTEGVTNPGDFYKMLISKPKLYDMLKESVNEIIKMRVDNGIIKNDFIGILLEFVKEKNGFDMDNILGNIAGFLSGIFESTAFSLACCLYEVSTHEDIREKLLSEIEENVGDELTYEAITKMQYLEMVLMETYRKHPIGSLLFRYCIKDYKLPGDNLIIDKGTPILIPVIAVHYDPEYYPDPETFNPERFRNKHKSPYMLGFGEGPRQCIAKLLGVLQNKVALIEILRNFNIEVNEQKTGPKLIFETVWRHMVLQYKNTIWINFVKK